MSLEMAHKVIVPQKKIMSRSFLNSGTLIVKIRATTLLRTIHILYTLRPRRDSRFTGFILSVDPTKQSMRRKGAFLSFYGPIQRRN